MQFPFPAFVTRLLSECFEAMKYIFGWRDPFEIVCSIIMLVSINMIKATPHNELKKEKESG